MGCIPGWAPSTSCRSSRWPTPPASRRRGRPCWSLATPTPAGRPTTLGVPCFLYGMERTLPDVRRGAFATLAPDTGSTVPHPTAGATAVGARGVLIAYNVWIEAAGPDRRPADEVEGVARTLAAGMRRPGLRTLGLAVGEGAQVSCNVVDPDRVPLDRGLRRRRPRCGGAGVHRAQGRTGRTPAGVRARSRAPSRDGVSSGCAPRTPSSSAWDPAGADRTSAGPGEPSAYDAAAARRCMAR